jgi:hypothetical protein
MSWSLSNKSFEVNPCQNHDPIFYIGKLRVSRQGRNADRPLLGIPSALPGLILSHLSRHSDCSSNTLYGIWIRNGTPHYYIPQSRYGLFA